MTSAIAKLQGGHYARVIAIAGSPRFIFPILAWVLAGAAWLTLRSPLLVAVVASAAIATTLSALASGTARVLAANLAAGALVFSAFELHAASNVKAAPSYDIAFGHGYYITHEVLGYAPSPNTLARSTLVRDGRVLYDVKYDIDADGHRSTPAKGAHVPRAALFFGCSNAFGEGLRGDETLPAYFERADAADRRSINLAFHGYGPHHMLALLQHGLEAKGLGDSKPDLGVYSWIPQHVTRAAGKAFWDSGPRYELDDDMGDRGLRFTSPRERAWGHAASIAARQSALVAKLLDMTVHRQDPASASDQDWDLMVRLVAESAQLFERRYGGRFVVLLGEDPVDADAGAVKKARERFVRAGLHVLVASELIPSIHQEPGFIAADLHPTAAFNERLATQLAASLARGVLESTDARAN